MDFRKMPTASFVSQGSVDTEEGLALMAGQQSIKSSFSSSQTDNSTGDLVKDYFLTLKVTYETKMGQSIGILGSIPQLGCWNTDNILKMTWSEGHVWVAENVKVSIEYGDKQYFMYKYVVINNGNLERYEQGIDRIADLKLLDKQEFSDMNVSYINQAPV